MGTTQSATCERPRATDGDSVRCNNRSRALRVVAIDAPEMGRCPRYRTCAEGDPRASKRALQRLLDRPGNVFRIIGQDRYNRDLVQIIDRRGRNLSCLMVEQGFADYKPEWSGRYARCRT